MKTMPNNDWLAFTLSNPDFDQPFEQAFASGRAFFVGPGLLRLEPNIPCHDRIVLSSGIHGNETAPMEILNQLVKAVLDGALDLTVNVLMIIGHPQAAVRQQRFCDVNLNRLFNGAWQRSSGLEVQRARQLELVVADFFGQTKAETGYKLHYDLHTAIRASVYERFAVHPYTAGQGYSIEQIRFYAACDVQAVLLSHQPTYTFSYHSYVQHGAQAATIELGQVKPFGNNDWQPLQPIYQALWTLLEQADMLQSDRDQVVCFEVVDELKNDASDYELCVPPETRNFTAFSKGHLLSRSSLSCYKVAQTGDAIVFPNAQVPIGQRSGLVVRQCSWQAVNWM